MSWRCFFACFFILFSACNKKHEDSKRKLRISFKYDPITIDPKKNSDPLSCNLINMLFEGLVYLEKDGSLSLAIAKSINISKNKLRYTFEIKNLFWSSGDPITSYDFALSWKKILDPNFPSVNAYFLYPIKNAKKAKNGLVSLDDVGIYTPNDKTLVVKLEHPTPSFLKMLAFTTFFPTNHKESESLQSFSGPFTLTDWKHNDFCLLKKNPHFWNEKNIKIDEIKIHIVPDENTSFKLHQNNQLDFLGSFFSPIPQDALASLVKQNKTCSIQYAGTQSCFFNVQSYPFQNINIRKAFAYAIDKKAIVEHICQNQCIEAHSLIPPILREGKEGPSFAEKSKELALYHFEIGLKELGIDRKTFPKLIFSTYQADLEKNISLAIQQQWQETLGVQVKLEHLDVKIFLDKLYKRNFQFCLMSIIAQYFDPINILERFIDPKGFKNFSSWYNPKFVRFLELSESSNKNHERVSYLFKAEKVLLKELPIVPIYHPMVTYIKSGSIDNIEITPLGGVDFRHAQFHNGDNE